MFKHLNKLCIIYSIPYGMYRDRIKLPIIRFVTDTVELYKKRTVEKANDVKELAFRGGIVAFATSLLIWLAVLMYFAFYFAYVPSVQHVRPVHLQFKACEKVKGICSFPSAHIQLTKRHQLLMSGQPYRIYVELEMPESPANTDLGMFMVCADFRSRDGTLVRDTCRLAMLKYHSPLLNMLRTITFSPFLIFGTAQQKQNVQVELFSDYEEDYDRPVTDIYIEIQTKYIELYSATMKISAHFSGLRYVMFHWPMLSASIGISSNLCFIALVCLISWYQLVNSEDYQNYLASKSGSSSEKSSLDMKADGDDSSSMDDASLLEDNSGDSESIKLSRSESSSREFVEILGAADETSDC